MPVLPTTPTTAAYSHTAVQAADASRSRAIEIRKESERAKPIRRGDDELVIGATNVEADGSVRRLKGNGDEETHEDRQERGAYIPDDKQSGKNKKSPTSKPRIDVKG